MKFTSALRKSSRLTWLSHGVFCSDSLVAPRAAWYFMLTSSGAAFSITFKAACGLLFDAPVISIEAVRCKLETFRLLILNFNACHLTRFPCEKVRALSPIFQHVYLKLQEILKFLEKHTYGVYLKLPDDNFHFYLYTIQKKKLCNWKSEHGVY